jgi:ABC-2 type transport system permease protein
MSSTAARLRAPVIETEAQRFVNLTWTLAVTDWKLRFYGSVLGVVWTLLKPFAFFGVIYVVFAEIADLGAGVKNYPAYILLSLVLFMFFAEVTGTSVAALVVRENLLRKMRFPHIVIPLSIAVTGLLNLGTTLIAVMIFLIALGVYPDLGWLQLIPMIALLTLLALGTGLLLSALFVRYRDVQPIWEVGSQMLFYASPILYVATAEVPSDWLQIYLCNPIASILTQMRHAIMDAQASSIFEAMGWRIVIPLGLTAVVFALGWFVFKREAPRVAENL